MSTIQNLDINLRGSDAGMSKSLDKAQASVKSFSGSIGSMASGLSGSAIAGFAGLAAGALAAGFSLHAVKEQIEQVSNIADAAQRLDIGTEALIGLQHAGMLAGMSADDMTGAVTKMEDSVSKAASGSAKLTKAFKMLGVDAKQLKTLAPDQQFNKLADALESVQNPADKVRLATQIFGDSKILNAIDGGSEGLKRMAEDAKYLGLTLDDATAASIEQAGDSLDRIGMAFTGAARQITASLAPAIEWTANVVTDAIVWITKEIQFWVGVFIDAAKITKVLWDNMGEVWDLGVVYVESALATLASDVAHVVTEVIPEAFTALFEFHLEFWPKLFELISTAAKQIWDYIASGGQTDFSLSFDGVVDSFSHAFDKVRKSIPRELNDTEKALQKDLAKRQAALGDKIGAALLPAEQEARNKKNKGGPGAAKDDGKGNVTASAFEAGSKETADIIAKIRGGSMEQTQEDILQQEKDNGDKLDRIADALEGEDADL